MCDWVQSEGGAERRDHQEEIEMKRQRKGREVSISLRGIFAECCNSFDFSLFVL